MSAARQLARRWAIEKALRRSGGSVSGIRTPNHAATANDTAAIAQKMSRQSPISRTPAPNAGASTGTTMNTINAIDMTRAIARPEKRSRTIATTDTREAATASPPATRAANSNEKLPAIAHKALATI